MKLVRAKLVPFRLLMPAGPGTHEWSRTYRDLIFEMAAFVDRRGGNITMQMVREFVAARPKTDIVASFSETEIGLLMRKSVEYDLPVSRRMNRRDAHAE